MKIKLLLIILLFCQINGGLVFAAYPIKNASNTGSKVNNESILKLENQKSVILKESSSNHTKLEVANATTPPFQSKKKWLALVLAFLVGVMGAHSFYMGQKTKGYIQLGVSTVGIGFMNAAFASSEYRLFGTLPSTFTIGIALFGIILVWSFIDFVRILLGALEPEEGFDS
jgi:hypothetical protein